MDKYVVDFDKYFRRYMTKWYNEHKDIYKNIQAMEDDVPEIYLTWLSTPAKWINDIAPGEYFNQFDNPEELFEYLLKYLVTGVSVPDPLMDRLGFFEQELKPILISVLTDTYSSFPRGLNISELKMIVLSMVQESDFIEDFKDSFFYILKHENSNEVVDNVVEILPYIQNDSIATEILDAYDNYSEYAQLAVMEYLCQFHELPKVYDLLVNSFLSSDNKAVHAGYLAEYGDTRAVQVLKTVLSDVGPCDSILGVKPELVIRRMVTKLPTKFEVPESGNVIFSAVYFEINEDTGLAEKIETIYENV